MAGKVEDIPILVAQAGPLNGQRWLLKDSLDVGRDDSCAIMIPSRQVSRLHARFTISPEGVYLEDLGSKNGTHCNGQLLLEPRLLQDGDVIQIALAQQFVFISSDATVPLDEEQRDMLMAQAQLPIRRLRLDKRSRRVWLNNEELLPPLSVSQYSLLELLYDHQGQVVERKALIENVWGEEGAVGVSEQALDALIRRLRDRLAAVDPAYPYLITVRGHGLRLDNPPLES